MAAVHPNFGGQHQFIDNSKNAGLPSALGDISALLLRPSPSEVLLQLLGLLLMLMQKKLNEFYLLAMLAKLVKPTPANNLSSSKSLW
jgi:hypothetical protein